MRRAIRPGLVLAALLTGGPLTLAGCGFAPLYGAQPGQADVNRELARVYVQNIPTRYGQTIRLALQKELSGPGPEKPDGYTLQVGGGASFEAVDIHQDNTSGRLRIIGTAHWRLFTVEQYPKLLAEGDARVLDGYDTTFEQYFAQTLNSESVQARVAQALARQMVQQISVWFRAHVEPNQAVKVDLPRYADPDAMPTDQGMPSQRTGADGFPASATGRLSNETNTTPQGVSTSGNRNR